MSRRGRPLRLPARERVVAAVGLLVLVAAGGLVVVLSGIAPAPWDRAPTGAGPYPATPSPGDPAAALPSGPPDADLTPSQALPTEPPVPSASPAPSASVLGTRCVPAPGARELRVVTFNIHSATRGDTVRLDRIAAEIRSWDADVVLLQEVDRFRRTSGLLDMPARLARATGTEYAFGLNVLRPGNSQYGVATLSRFPILGSENVSLPMGGGIQRRGLLRTDIDVDGTTVSVYNTHLDHGGQAPRVVQMRTVMRLVGGQEHPVVLGGDFNATSRSPVLDLTRPTLRDSFADVGKGGGPTVPSIAPRRRIDYLLYSAPLVPRASQVLVSAVSDHRAVGTTLLVPSGEDPVCLPVLDGAVGGSGDDSGDSSGEGDTDRE